MNSGFFTRTSVLILLALSTMQVAVADQDEVKYRYMSNGDSVTFEELLKEKVVQAALDPDIRIYWKAEEAPGFVEESPTEAYSESSPGRPGLYNRCVVAFAGTLAKIIQTAKQASFDSVVVFHGVEDDEVLPAGSMHCSGWNWTRTSLRVKLGLSKERADSVRQIATISPREPAKDAMFLPVGDLVSAEDVKAAMPQKSISWLGQAEPQFKERFGPDLYSEYADYREIGIPAACRKAFVATLAYMATYANEYSHDGLIRVQSFLEDKPTPKIDEYECVRYDRKLVQVTLRGATIKTIAPPAMAAKPGTTAAQ